MFMDEGMDTGDILLQEETPIGPEENAGELHDRLAISGAALLVRTIEGLLAGTIRRRPQESNLATLAPRLSKDDGLIHWERRGSEITNLIRGLAPAPCAYTWLDGKQVKVFSASVQEQPVTEPPGKIGTSSTSGLSFPPETASLCSRTSRWRARNACPSGSSFGAIVPGADF